MREDQETPYHHHRVKIEDIIVRGGGNLIVELHNNADGGLADTPVAVMVDGDAPCACSGRAAHTVARVTITRNLWHRFYGEASKGTVFVGEVSQVNDDLTDNYFLEKLGQ